MQSIDSTDGSDKANCMCYHGHLAQALTLLSSHLGYIIADRDYICQLPMVHGSYCNFKL